MSKPDKGDARQGRFEHVLAILCILILGGILTAGLWPFQAPPNQATWLQNARGLRLGQHGTIIGSLPFEVPSRPIDQCGLELWLRPDEAYGSGTILAFSGPHMIPFSLHQSELDLAIQKHSENAHLQKRGNLVFVDDVFLQRAPVFLTITSSPAGTNVYIDGVLVQTVPAFALSSADLAGELVLGTSPVVNDSWSGVIWGLAIYARDLAPSEVSQHFRTWTTVGRPDIGEADKVRALYFFDEGRGRVVRDHSPSLVNLQIPERYMILREKFLEPPWSEFHMHWGYWKNVLINVGGFVPLGFFLFAYLTTTNRFRRPAAVTIGLGFIVSLTIELLQAWLPTRDSGTTDIVTNTLGSALGVGLYRLNAGFVAKAVDRFRLSVYR